MTFTSTVVSRGQLPEVVRSVMVSVEAALPAKPPNREREGVRTLDRLFLVSLV